ncbi:MAG TPA: hypothetical protein VF103_18215, partial [Polyangiaceae bacterium]
RFRMLSGAEHETALPEAKVALYELGRVFPHALRLDDLAERVSEHLGATVTVAELARILLDAETGAFVRVFSAPPPSVRAPSDKPEATSVARAGAERGGVVTNLYGDPVRLENAFQRRLLALLDGTRDRSALSRELGSDVDGELQKLARFALLIR